ncbi:MAG: ChrR family anti-sigma-E factor [Rhodobacteraceae bacterium]|nr:ChrR family anti-sigma-E factor [Paracoccaceae bacterium]
MAEIEHHLTEPLLAAYAAGNLPQAYELVVAAHVSLCVECRARLGAHENAGGAVLETLPGAALSAGLRDRVMAALDAPPPAAAAVPRRSGIFPAPVMAALKGQPPRWKTLGGGVRQQILQADAEGSARLLYIPPGVAVPDHGHGGLELTLVLQGAFSDKTGGFGTGDVEIAGPELEHQPVADIGPPCICLAATDAPLRFHALIPRLLQPFFRI